MPNGIDITGVGQPILPDDFLMGPMGGEMIPEPPLPEPGVPPGSPIVAERLELTDVSPPPGGFQPTDTGQVTPAVPVSAATPAVPVSAATSEILAEELDTSDVSPPMVQGDPPPVHFGIPLTQAEIWSGVTPLKVEIEKPPPPPSLAVPGERVVETVSVLDKDKEYAQARGLIGKFAKSEGTLKDFQRIIINEQDPIVRREALRIAAEAGIPGAADALSAERQQQIELERQEDREKVLDNYLRKKKEIQDQNEEKRVKAEARFESANSEVRTRFEELSEERKKLDDPFTGKEWAGLIIAGLSGALASGFDQRISPLYGANQVQNLINMRAKRQATRIQSKRQALLEAEGLRDLEEDSLLKLARDTDLAQADIYKNFIEEYQYIDQNATTETTREKARMAISDASRAFEQRMNDAALKQYKLLQDQEDREAKRALLAAQTRKAEADAAIAEKKAARIGRGKGKGKEKGVTPANVVLFPDSDEVAIVLEDTPRGHKEAESIRQQLAANELALTKINEILALYETVPERGMWDIVTFKKSKEWDILKTKLLFLEPDLARVKAGGGKTTAGDDEWAEKQVPSIPGLWQNRASGLNTIKEMRNQTEKAAVANMRGSTRVERSVLEKVFALQREKSLSRTKAAKRTAKKSFDSLTDPKGTPEERILGLQNIEVRAKEIAKETGENWEDIVVDKLSQAQAAGHLKTPEEKEAFEEALGKIRGKTLEQEQESEGFWMLPYKGVRAVTGESEEISSRKEKIENIERKALPLEIKKNEKLVKELKKTLKKTNDEISELEKSIKRWESEVKSLQDQKEFLIFHVEQAPNDKEKKKAQEALDIFDRLETQNIEQQNKLEELQKLANEQQFQLTDYENKIQTAKDQLKKLPQPQVD